MAGSGGIGAVPSSRLTKILQEKAALLKKQKETAEVVIKTVQERIQQLATLGIVLPEVAERDTQLQETIRKTDWTLAETQARALLQLLSVSAGSALSDRRRVIAARAEALKRSGPALPDGFDAALAAAERAAPGDDWGAAIDALARLDASVHVAQRSLATSLRRNADRYVDFGTGSDAARSSVGLVVDAAADRIEAGDFTGAIDSVTGALRHDVPGGASRRDDARRSGEELVGAGRDLGVPTDRLESALKRDADATTLDWPETVPDLDAAAGQLGEALRERVGQVLESLQRTLESLKEYDVDTTDPLAAVAELTARLPTAPPADLPRVLREGRSATEEPVVSVVASLLDAVRPKLVDARRLGRDASDVFAAMNRAREALRLKIYSEALAASQEAIDRVGRITSDLDAARGEADSLRDLLDRLSGSKFPIQSFHEALDQVKGHLDRVELAPARELLAQTIRRLGSETVAYFSDRFASLDRVLEVAKERGFLPEGASESIADARQALESGRLSEAAELAAAAEARVRVAAGPYVSRRVEELEAGFREIPDASLIAPVKRFLADADVALRVKEDLFGSLDSLRRAEREFSAVFADHASTLVEMLEEERSILESMGGTGDEIQRQIDEVQQIFNMGDFVKASRTSQEIRTRAHQQQLVRSEEAVSHAKLALVELTKMGLDAGSMKNDLEGAQTASREQRYAEAYRGAKGVLDAAGRIRASADRVLAGIASASDLWQSLKQAGIAVDTYRDQLKLARTAYQALDFAGAESVLGQLTASLETARDEAEARRLRSDIQLLAEDAQRLGLSIESPPGGKDPVAAALDDGRSKDAVEIARRSHRELTSLLRPVLSEHLRSVEQDLDVAQAAGLTVPEIVERVGEARRRLALPVPTGVAELIDRARTQLIETRGFLEHAERVARRARDTLNEAELVRVDVQLARPRLGPIDQALARREYAKVIELASTLERDMLQATRQQVSKTLAAAQATISRARHDGSDTAVAENLLQQARADLEEGHPVDAIAKATRSEAELERIELQLRIAQGSVQTMERNLALARSEGIRSTSAEEAVGSGRTALERRDFPGVFEAAVSFTDILDGARESYRRSREALDAADRQLKLALELGADVQEVVATMDRARLSHSTGEYARGTTLAREAAEAARWSVERLYSTTVSDVRTLLETGTAAGAGERLGPVREALEEAETALKAREWSRANVALERARTDGRGALEGLLGEREGHLRGRYAVEPEGTPAELTARDDFARRLAEERTKGRYSAALELVAAEESRLAQRQRQVLERSLADLKERLWVGEKLGLDTTPVMELFSEAGIALQAGRLDPIDDLVRRADEQLNTMVVGRLSEKFDELSTELNFAREGLHVSVDSIAEDLRSVSQLRADGKTVAAARGLLAAADELNRRKSAHRELLNLHYLVDAALSRASERHLDTAAARALLDASISARATDYDLALGKAREALALLQSLLKTPSDTPSGFFAIRRPPGGTPT